MTGPAAPCGRALFPRGVWFFFGDHDGQLVAVKAANGRSLWHNNMGVFAFGLFEPSGPAVIPPQSPAQ